MEVEFKDGGLEFSAYACISDIITEPYEKDPVFLEYRGLFIEQQINPLQCILDKWGVIYRKAEVYYTPREPEEGHRHYFKNYARIGWKLLIGIK